MRVEYIAAFSVVIVILSFVAAYYAGKASWYRILPNRRTRSAFWIYRLINRNKLNRLSGYKNVILLHLIKIGDEITSITPNFSKAKREFESKTIFELIDIYDDRLGHRYLKIGTDKGEFIFEIAEYFRTALNQKIKEEEIAVREIKHDKKDDAIPEELKTKPMLKIVRNQKAGGMK